MAKLLYKDEPVIVELTLLSRDAFYLWPDTDNKEYDQYAGGATNAPLQDHLTGPFIDQDVCSQFFINTNLIDGTQILNGFGWHIDEASPYYIDDASMISYADEEENRNVFAAFAALQEWEKYIKRDDEENPSMDPCCIYLHRLFVEPEYRQKKLASTILKQLNVLFAKYGQTLRYAVTIVNPDEPTDGTKEEMTDIMIQTLQKAGFVQIGTTGGNEPHPIYAKHYPL